MSEEFNIGWFYYKEYFRDVDFSGLLEEPQALGKIGEDKNKKLLEAFCYKMPEIGEESQSIQAKVCYPGLITGVGIGHEARVNGEFKLGMHFDYTYGMPVIYGSSVKGLLRSMFGQEAYIEGLLKEIGIEGVAVVDLEKNIFDGKGEDGILSVYKRDIFYDAVITKPNARGHILEKDTLAPHGKDPLKNPQPLTFLKIASGVIMEFRFDLKPFQDRDEKTIINPQQKRDLFKKILTDVGIGAKTNVGYGQLEIVETKRKIVKLRS